MRITRRLVALVMALSLFFTLAGSRAEGGVADITNADIFAMMVDDFKSGRYDDALNKATRLQQNSYPDVALYYYYLTALRVYLPKADYSNAYKFFNITAQAKFEKSEGYASYSLGMLEKSKGNYEAATEYFNKAVAQGVYEAAYELVFSPTTMEITVKEGKKTDVSVELSWVDENEGSSYVVSWFPVGMGTLKQQKEVSEKRITLTNLLPNTDYSVTIEASGNPACSGTFTTNTVQAVLKNSIGVVNPRFSLDGAELPVSLSAGSRKPSEQGKKYSLRMISTANESKKERKVDLMWVLRLDGKACAQKTTAVIEANTTWIAANCDLTECLDAFYANQVQFAGKLVTVDIYVNGDFLMTQPLIQFEE